VYSPGRQNILITSAAYLGFTGNGILIKMLVRLDSTTPLTLAKNAGLAGAALTS
jgi:hypothetical protein